MAKRSNTEVIKSRAIFESKIDTIAQLQVDVASLKAARDEEKEELLLKWNDEIKAIESEIKKEQNACLAYATVNWEELADNGSKSASTPLAVYGFRTGQPTVKVIGKRKEAEVAAELKEAGHAALINETYKLNKSAIMVALDNGVDLVKRLFRRDQKERFFVEAKAQQED